MTFSCLKKRIVDCLIKAGEVEADVEHIRLWLCTDKPKLLQSWEQLAKTPLTQEETENDEEVEINTGVEFPGHSFEHVVGTAYTVDEKDFSNEIVFIEFAQPNFLYKF